MASAGRILIIPKGNYDAAAAYENLDLVFYNGDSWLCKKACTGVVPSDVNSEYWHRFTEVDVPNKAVPFAQAGSRTNLASGDTVATGFGKIAKWFGDLKSAAFAEIANNLTTATAGKVLDALQGKTLADMIGSTNTNVTNLTTRMTSAENAITEQNSNLSNHTHYELRNNEYRATMQSDGNFVVYDSDDNVYFGTKNLVEALKTTYSNGTNLHCYYNNYSLRIRSVVQSYSLAVGCQDITTLRLPLNITTTEDVYFDGIALNSSWIPCAIVWGIIRTDGVIDVRTSADINSGVLIIDRTFMNDGRFIIS